MRRRLFAVGCGSLCMVPTGCFITDADVNDKLGHVTLDSEETGDTDTGDTTDTDTGDTDTDTDADTAVVDGDGDGVTVADGDCDDTNPDVRPGAVEDCLTTDDDDCNGSTNDPDAVGCSPYYPDLDADDWGAGTSACLCAASEDFPVSNASDCDDGDPEVNPGASEVCRDGVDNDCDSAADACTLADSLVSDATVEWTGEAAGDHSGCSVAGAGDVDRDGRADFLVGAFDTSAGTAYLILGSASTGSRDLSAADMVMTGEAAGDNAGRAVAGAGDVDGDGYADFLVGAPVNGRAAESAGAAYLLRGSAAPSASLDLAAAAAIYTGEGTDDQAGYRLAGAGDVNADGYADVLIGSYDATDAAGAWLVLGSASPASGSLSAASAHYTTTRPDDYSGYSVAGAGDVDGDGFADLLVGAPHDKQAGTDSGVAFLILGTASPASMGLTAADSAIAGGAANDRVGDAVAGAGDLNGDGYADVLIGADGLDDAADGAGAAYVSLGGPSGTLAMSLTLLGEAAGDTAGTSLAGLGDTDQDGYDDVLVGAPGSDHNGTESGSAWLVLGSSSPASIGLEYADAQISGAAASDRLGYASTLAGPGDVDADGYADLLFGSFQNDDAGVEAGAAWLLFGTGP